MDRHTNNEYFSQQFKPIILLISKQISTTKDIKTYQMDNEDYSQKFDSRIFITTKDRKRLITAWNCYDKWISQSEDCSAKSVKSNTRHTVFI